MRFKVDNRKILQLCENSDQKPIVIVDSVVDELTKLRNILEKEQKQIVTELEKSIRSSVSVTSNRYLQVCTSTDEILKNLLTCFYSDVDAINEKYPNLNKLTHAIKQLDSYINKCKSQKAYYFTTKTHVLEFKKNKFKFFDYVLKNPKKIIASIKVIKEAFENHKENKNDVTQILKQLPDLLKNISSLIAESSFTEEKVIPRVRSKSF